MNTKVVIIPRRTRVTIGYTCVMVEARQLPNLKMKQEDLAIQLNLPVTSLSSSPTGMHVVLAALSYIFTVASQRDAT